jgi:hypothetical protein
MSIAMVFEPFTMVIETISMVSVPNTMGTKPETILLATKKRVSVVKKSSAS